MQPQRIAQYPVVEESSTLQGKGDEGGDYQNTGEKVILNRAVTFRRGSPQGRTKVINSEALIFL